MSSSESSNAQYATSTTPSAERIRGVVVFMWSLMLIVVSLRFVARRLAKAALWHDDWLIILAAVCPFPSNPSSISRSKEDDLK